MTAALPSAYLGSGFIRSRYNAVVGDIESLLAFNSSTQASIDALRLNEALSPEEKSRQAADLRELLLQHTRSENTRLTFKIDALEKDAADALAGSPTNAVLEAAKARAAHRLDLLTSTDLTFAEIARTLADEGDLTGIRVLREELPGLIASRSPKLNREARTHILKAARLAVDRASIPLLSVVDAQVVKVLANLDDLRAHLAAAGAFCVKSGSASGSAPSDLLSVAFSRNFPFADV